MDDQDRCERRELLASCGRAMASEGKCHLRTRLELGGLSVTKGPAIGTEDSETPLPHFLGGFQGQHPQWAIHLALPHSHLAGPQSSLPGLQLQQEVLGVRAGMARCPSRSFPPPSALSSEGCLHLGWASWILPWSWVGGVGTRESGWEDRGPKGTGPGHPGCAGWPSARHPALVRGRCPGQARGRRRQG